MSAIDPKTMNAHYEVLEGVADHVEKNLSILSNIEKNWQPTDFLPDLTREDWHEQLHQFREMGEDVSDELLVVLVGNMVTEEALPNYSVSLNLLARDTDGNSPKPWAQWLRGWTAEENRHGDLLNAYLRLTGRVNMRSVEITIQHLINNGFNPRNTGDPYCGVIYPAFQERATRISHGNVGRIVKNQGEQNLSSICRSIAGDESRHELFYTRIMHRIFHVDPDGALQAMHRMIRGLFAMPGMLMYDGNNPNLFHHFALIAQRTGVYTFRDYADILDHLVQTWNIANYRVAGNAARAQEYICRQAERYDRIVEEYESRAKQEPELRFNWIHDRVV